MLRRADFFSDKTCKSRETPHRVEEEVLLGEKNDGLFVQKYCFTGISTPVFLVYQFLVATIFMVVMALIFERSNRPPLTIPILIRIFLLALLGLTMSTNLLAASLFFISSTIQAAVFNMVPVFIFLISITSRQEKLGIETLSGQGKLFGILLSVSGALVLTLWHGSSSSRLTSGLGNWPLGLFMVVLGVLCLSAWITLLGPMSKQYPSDISLNALMFFFATIQTALIALFVSPVLSQWQLKWSLELLNIFFGAVCYNGLSNLFITWCATVKGPTFIASFSPLGLLFATLLETLFLGQTLHMGSAAGAVLIVFGLYIFLFSKSKEETQYYFMDEEAYVAEP
ncbi:WAT1-related protein At4g01440-like [Aristolochia californica]|uniref:WAT1-related protein At4g01440-like n=1 Tax=Aristolochia californica TaxID=171875 RepID=UPI0035D5F9D8